METTYEYYKYKKQTQRLENSLKERPNTKLMPAHTRAAPLLLYEVLTLDLLFRVNFFNTQVRDVEESKRVDANVHERLGATARRGPKGGKPSELLRENVVSGGQTLLLL